MRLSLLCLAPVLCVACDSVHQPQDSSRTIGSPPGALVYVDGVDRIESDTHPGTRRTLVAINRGYHGGAELAWLEHQQVIRQENVSQQTISRPLWSPDGQGFAYVEHEPARPTGACPACMLQFRGRILWERGHGGRTVVEGIENASRVLGWAGEESLIITRFEPGDFGEERPYLVALQTGAARPLSAFAGHMYSIAWTGERVVFAGSQGPIVTAPAPGESVGIYATALSGETQQLGSEEGHVPTRFRMQGDALDYELEGAQRSARLDLRTGRKLLTPITRVAIPPAPQLSLLDLTMPYVHQVYDTPNDFNGHWACGPTSTLMAVLHFGRLEKWPETVDVPTSHTSDYGAYVSRKYTAYGTTFDTPQGDASGVTAWGAYGWCTENGAAWAWRMQDYAKRHELNSDFDATATLAKLKAALDEGKVVALSTQLTSAGHIIAVKGYTADDKLVVNDPYGDANAGYMNYKGEGAVYSFAQVQAKWFITVYASGPQFKASIVAQNAPATMTSGETATASITYKNEGWAGWDNTIVLGTTEPRDRKSPFQSADWSSENRAAGMPAKVAPGEQGTINFTLTAPTVCAPQSYTEHFNLVQDGVAWFSDGSQGGPADDAVAFTITVNPAPGGCAEAGASEAGDAADAGAPSDANVSQPDVMLPDGGKPDGAHGFFGPSAEEGCSCHAAGARGGWSPWLYAAVASGLGAWRRRKRAR